MKETKNTFTIEETDNFNCIFFGTYKKAINGDRCPKCKSTCLVHDNLPHQQRGRCAKCGYWGKLRDFKRSKSKVIHMGEPLNKKDIIVFTGNVVGLGKLETKAIELKKLDSAVEWLKEQEKEIERQFKNRSYKLDVAMVEEIFRRFKEKIDQAFQVNK